MSACWWEHCGLPKLPIVVNEVLASPGRPLDKETRAFFEPRFGFDFGQVRLNTDGHAADIAQTINARAFTLGRHFAFGSGQYAPESRVGRHLIAHELTQSARIVPRDV